MKTYLVIMAKIIHAAKETRKTETFTEKEYIIWMMAFNFSY